MAEIEHFHDPADKSHPKFAGVKDTEMTFYSADNQMNGELPAKLTIGQAVDKVSEAQLSVDQGQMLGRLQQVRSLHK